MSGGAPSQAGKRQGVGAGRRRSVAEAAPRPGVFRPEQSEGLGLDDAGTAGPGNKHDNASRQAVLMKMRELG